MKEKIIYRVTTSALITVMFINIFILTRIRMTMTDDSILRENKASYILPDGFTPEINKITWDESISMPSGWVVRYTRKGCHFCALDTEWSRLVSHLDRNNYRTILLLPTDADQYDEDQMFSGNVKQLAFVKMEWVRQFRFTGTPTTIIFDNNGRVLWRQFGMLTEDDYKSAEKAVERHKKS